MNRQNMNFQNMHTICNNDTGYQTSIQSQFLSNDLAIQGTKQNILTLCSKYCRGSLHADMNVECMGKSVCAALGLLE